MKIQSIHAREILDSRGYPTVEAELLCDNHIQTRASVPSGASTGIHEALELRDGGQRYAGKGVQTAVEHINTTVNRQLADQHYNDFAHFDHALIALDPSENKSQLGANAVLAVSIAGLRAFAKSEQIPLYKYINRFIENPLSLPVPMMNIVNGGAHADNDLDIQEFMIIPHGAASFKEALRYGAEIFHVLKTRLKSAGLNTAVGDEGGFAPSFKANSEALDYLMAAIHQAGFKPGQDVSIALDVASSELFKQGQYQLNSENRQLTASEFSDYLATLCKAYPIVSIEDGMAEEDWVGWSYMSEQLQHLQLVGDDLFVTNTKRLQLGIDKKVANAILIKPNQIGSVSQTLSAIQLAKQYQYRTVISHRSGETEDTFIADLAVGVGANQIKTGSLCRGERIAKYNQLLRIEEQLGNQATFVGKSVFGGQ